MWADDLVILAQGTTVEECERKQQAALHKLQEWSERWKMNISFAKTEQILFTLNPSEVNGKRHPNIHFQIDPKERPTVYISKKDIGFKKPKPVVSKRRRPPNTPPVSPPVPTCALRFEQHGRPVLAAEQNFNDLQRSKFSHVHGTTVVACNALPVRSEGELLEVIGRAPAGADLKLQFASPVRYNTNPKLLGCYIDGQLLFNGHIDHVKKRLQQSNKLLRRYTGATFGVGRPLLRQLHIGCGQARADFACGVYGSFASEKQRDRIEAEQRRAACIVSGCTSTTPGDAALREAELLPLELRARQHAATLLERARRLPHHLDPESLVRPTPTATRISHGGGSAGSKGITRGCWRATARSTSAAAGTLYLRPEEQLIAPPRPPWEWTATPAFHTELIRPVRRWESAAVRRQAALDTLAQCPGADAYLSPDGSAERGVRNGGSGWVICTPNGTELLSGWCAAGRLCSSYHAECVAMRNALRDLQRALLHPKACRPHLQLLMGNLVGNSCIASCMPPMQVQVLWDSQSAVRSLSKGPIAQRKRIESEIWDLIEQLWVQCRCELTFRWIPSHTNEGPDAFRNLLWGNTVADDLADRGSRLPQFECPVNLKCAAAAIRRHVADIWQQRRPREHWHWTSTGGRKPVRLDDPQLEKVVACLRTGHSPLLQQYLHRIGAEESATCQSCGLEPETAAHCLTCPARPEARLRHLRHKWEDPTVLASHPQWVIDYLWEIGKLQPILGDQYGSLGDATVHSSQ